MSDLKFLEVVQSYRMQGGKANSIGTLEDMAFTYFASDEYQSLSAEARRDVMANYRDIKDLIKGLSVE